MTIAHHDDFEDTAGSLPDADGLILSLDGYDGPLDLLLHLAKEQKVDLAKISILDLAKQYLDFVRSAQALDLELASEYLVMAAWLAYLKSKWLLPIEDDEETESAQEMSLRLQLQLQRLQAFRQAQEALIALPQLGRDQMCAGTAAGVRISNIVTYENTIGDLLQAYSLLGARMRHSVLHVKPQRMLSMESALERLRPVIGSFGQWASLQAFMPKVSADPLLARSAVSSTFYALLQLTNEGLVELRQDHPDAPLFARHKES